MYEKKSKIRSSFKTIGISKEDLNVKSRLKLFSSKLADSRTSVNIKIFDYTHRSSSNWFA